MSSIPEAVAAIRRGQMVILVDDEDRENEGDLVMAAELVTPEAINFMAKHARGLICLTLTEERLAALDIPMMVATNTAALGTAFTVSIEAKAGVSTGISAADRSHTIRVAMEEATRPSDLARPGHVFPLRARRGGVLVRTGQTEGSVDLARMAGCKPGGVICEIMNDDGSMARRSDLEIFAKQHGLLIVTIAELIEYRLEHDRLVKRVDSARIDHPRWGELTAHVYTTEIDNDEHLALIFGKLTGSVLVRVQSGPGAWFDGIMSNGQALMNGSLDRLAEEGSGIFIGISHGGSGGSLSQALLALRGEDALEVSVPLREFGIGAQILRDLEVKSIRLLSNHPRRLPGIGGFGLELTETVSFTALEKPKVKA